MLFRALTSFEIQFFCSFHFLKHSYVAIWPGQPQLYYGTQIGLEFVVILLPQPFSYWEKLSLIFPVRSPELGSKKLQIRIQSYPLPTLEKLKYQLFALNE